MDDGQRRRTLLVVVDATDESRLAVAYAARWAKRMSGTVSVLHVLPPTDFVQWGAVQAAIEREARDKGEALLASIADEVEASAGQQPKTLIRVGEPGPQVLEALGDDPTLAALVLGSASKGPPGPLVTFFSGDRAGALPCPVVIVPGGLALTEIDRLT